MSSCPSPGCAPQFGSGWAWLVTDKSGKLSITKTPNAVVPVVEGKTPILTVDVWEHAYYIDFQVRWDTGGVKDGRDGHRLRMPQREA